MYSEYVLFCAPYRFESRFLSRLNEAIVKKELLSVVMPGINFATKKLVKLGLKNNYGIEDQNSLEAVLEALQKGEFQHPKEMIDDIINHLEDEQQKAVLLELFEMAQGKGLQGFDDCRIIDTLTKAYAANLIEKTEFNRLFEQHTNRIKESYQSFEQYLASCVLGKAFQFAQKSFSITTEEEFFTAIYGYCIAAFNVFSLASFWQDTSLDRLGLALAQLLKEDYQQDKKSVLENQVDTSATVTVEGLSDDLVEHLTEQNFIVEELIDLARYPRLSNLAEYVLWQPIVEQGLEWLLTPLKGEQDTLLMPKELSGIHSAEFYWIHYDKLTTYHDQHIFAIFVGALNVLAVFTEKAAYRFDKKMFFKKVVVEIPWHEVQLEAKVDFDMDGTYIYLNGKKIFDMLGMMDYTAIGLSKDIVKNMNEAKRKQMETEWAEKLNAVLREVPTRLKAFLNENK